MIFRTGDNYLDTRRGRVQITLECRKNKGNYSAIFAPKISNKVNANLRWPVYRENWYWRGIRIGDKGNIVLKCWFKDDVEAEISYRQERNYTARQVAALVFVTKKGTSIGNNFGSQSVKLSKSGKVKKRKGKIEGIARHRRRDKFKLVVKNGKFSSYMNGQKISSMKYSQKSFSSGRIGFIWKGGIASFISDLNITGRLDYDQMFKQLKKFRDKQDD